MQTSFKSPHRLDLHITGRVQGVGFRQYALQQAQRLGLNGWVRNESDGSVHLVAEGSIDDLRTLFKAVSGGPRTAHVQNVLAEWEEGTGQFRGFAVR